MTDRTIKIGQCAAVRTTPMKERELKPPKPLKVGLVSDLEIGPEQLIELQRSDETLKRYRQLADKPAESQLYTRKGTIK